MTKIKSGYKDYSEPTYAFGSWCAPGSLSEAGLFCVFGLCMLDNLEAISVSKVFY